MYIADQLGRLTRIRKYEVAKEIIRLLKRHKDGLTYDLTYLHWLYEPLLEELMWCLWHNEGYGKKWKNTSNVFLQAPYYANIEPHVAHEFLKNHYRDDPEEWYQEVLECFCQVIPKIKVENFRSGPGNDYWITIFNYVFNARCYTRFFGILKAKKNWIQYEPLHHYNPSTEQSHQDYYAQKHTDDRLLIWLKDRQRGWRKSATHYIKKENIWQTQNTQSLIEVTSPTSSRS